MFHIIELIEEFGPNVGELHVKSISGKQNKGLFEMRPRGKEGIARVFFCSVIGREVVILNSYIKKSSIKHQQRDKKLPDHKQGSDQKSFQQMGQKTSGQVSKNIPKKEEKTRKVN